MEFISLNVDFLNFRIGDLYSGWILIPVKVRVNAETGSCGGRRDQVKYHLMAYQGFPSPVLAYEGEQAMLNFIPFACPRREMTHADLKPRFIRQLLQFNLP